MAKPKVMNRRQFLVSTSAGLAAGTGVLSGVGSARGQGRRDLAIGLFGEPPGLNEFRRTDIQGSLVTGNIYHRLAETNYDKGVPDPVLAEGWTQEGPTKWLVKLRPGIKWHKGYGELTAEDVAYTVNYTVENKTFQFGSGMAGVKGATVRGKHLVEYELARPFGGFANVNLDYGGTIMCKKAHEEMGERNYSRNPIGTGPYEFSSWVSGSHIVLKKAKGYTGPARPGHLEEVTWRFMPDPSVRADALLKGEVDISAKPDWVAVPKFRSGQVKGFKYATSPGWNWDYIAFNYPPHVPPDFPTLRQEVRQAISYAIDREALVKEIYNGDATSTDSPVPPGFLAYRKPPLRYPMRADLAKAKELMAKAGARGFELEMITSSKDWLRRETELVAAMLSEIGITVKPQGLDMGTYTERWKNSRKFQSLLEDITIVSPDTDSAVYHFAREGTGNWFGWKHPQINEWLDEGRRITAPEQRRPVYHKAVDAILEGAGYIYLAHVNNTYVHSDKLQGVMIPPQELTLRLNTMRWA
jgi:peptide/nickel transport system substrate-binding protein